ncbi:carboxylating nicotinate-nucleotide diphosphorylase [Gracilimonas mengyeensis]|uniref:Probable nicotinate-nucleotide pyrophosphorylase [carboxylating] n=1 Tax=Gracilimonas mengyeensis TaxID=1302730 RepID=A0A521CWV2_9BACT|nr:carboxylating nicotinate-nucleotide diphosphorylase [Gracilimonas mengyeensis]SMO63924.1 nicotinate-nucleotide pyrophosphorylase [carboxylating] [Gracilimonas mengyeensis]
MNQLALSKIIETAFAEDMGMGDLTTESIFSGNQAGKGVYTAKADGVLAGLDIIQTGYGLLDESVSVTLHKNDGHPVQKGEKIAEVESSVRTLLSGERVILNLIQHLSGIATATREVINLLDDSSITITDTRKTLPGLRALQKYAVRCGGGKNHRFRLDDGVIIKDNHIKAAGSIQSAVKLVRARVGHMVNIEVETETKEQIQEAVKAKADVIMLDNRSPEEVKELAQLIPNEIIVEVSGGITPQNIAGYKGCGADVISLGWLTHSVTALDISFNLE